MKQGNIIAHIAYLILFFILQVIFFRNVVLFGYAVCFIYVGYILIMPINTTPIQMMVIALVLGLLIDSFYDTVGINAFACVFIAYVRQYILNFLTPRGGYDTTTEISIPYMGFFWFIKYAALLIFIHHLLFFTIEAWNFANTFSVIIKSILSTLFTLSMIILLQFLVNKTNK